MLSSFPLPIWRTKRRQAVSSNASPGPSLHLLTRLLRVPGAPNLNLSVDEKRVYGQLFRQADTDSVGVVTGEIAVKFFEKTRLDSRILGRSGSLRTTRTGASSPRLASALPSGSSAMRKQAGSQPPSSLSSKALSLDLTASLPPAPTPAPTAPLQAQGTGGPIRIPPLTPEKVNQYAGFFERQTLQGDKLPGEQAKQIFEKSGLPNEVLGRIWMLADTEQRGSLVLTEFVIAMHLLYSMKTGALRGLPSIIPAPLYEAAQRRGSASGTPTPIPRQQSPISTTPPVPAIPRQFTGQGALANMRTGSPLGRPPLSAQATGDWLVTSGDKERFDKIYDELDKSGKGFITGEEAVTFFGSSKLSEEILAQIWDLADIRSEGRLNKDEFAVAMYLIRQQRMKPDGSITIPSTLPPTWCLRACASRPARRQLQQYRPLICRHRRPRRHPRWTTSSASTILFPLRRSKFPLRLGAPVSTILSPPA